MGLIIVFVDDKIAVVRKYHKENNTVCQWDKFILNGIISGLSVGNHVVKVYSRNISASAAMTLIYGGVGRNTTLGNPPCTNMSNFMARMNLSTTIVESL